MRILHTAGKAWRLGNYAGSTQDFRSQFSKVVSSIITQGSIDQEESGAKKGLGWIGTPLLLTKRKDYDVKCVVELYYKRRISANLVSKLFSIRPHLHERGAIICAVYHVREPYMNLMQAPH